MSSPLATSKLGTHCVPCVSNTLFLLGVDCRRDSRLCDPNAECVLNVDTFVCVCNEGYRGDGTSCTREYFI